MPPPLRQAGVWRAVLAVAASTGLTALWLWGFYLYAHQHYDPPPLGVLGPPMHILPPVYLAPFYAVLRAIPDKLIGTIAIIAAVFLFFLTPWILTARWRRRVGRPIAAVLLLVYVLSLATLTMAGWQEPEEPVFGTDPGVMLLGDGLNTWIWLCRAAAAYFFAYALLIAPMLGREDRRAIARTFD